MAGFWTPSCHRSDPSGSIPESAAGAGRAILHVATSGDYRPFSQWDESVAEPNGFSADVARAFARDRGLEIRWTRFRWALLLAELAANRFDVAISGITVRPERSIAGRFSYPLTTSGAVVLVRASSEWRTAEALNRPGVRLAVNAGGHLERVARELFAQASVEAVPRNGDVLGRLRNGGGEAGGQDRIEGVLTDTLEAPHWQMRSDQALRLIGPLTQDRKAALFPANRSQLAQDFDDWLMRAESNGELARLRQEYALPADATAAPMAALLASLDERLSLMRSVARVKRILDLPVEDLEREERVLDAAWRSVERAALFEGRRPPKREAVERLFRAQIEAAKWIQRAALDGEFASLAGPGEKPDADSLIRARRELDDALRPALIRLGDRIARLVAKLEETAAPRLGFATTAAALSRHRLPESHLRALHEALLSLLPAAAEPVSSPRPPRATRDTAPSA